VEIDEAKRLAGRPRRHGLRDEHGGFVDPTPTAILRIDAIAAGAVVARADTAETLAITPDEDEDCSITEVAEFEMPAWVDPPTGAVPRVLLDQSDVVDLNGEVHRGPTWRQEAESFLEDIDLSFLVPEDGPDDAIAGRDLDPEAPFAFTLEEDRDLTRLPIEPIELEAGDEAAWSEVLVPTSTQPRARRRHVARRQHLAAPVSGRRNLVRATLTGLALGAVAIGCFLIGSVGTEALIALGATVAAGELFAVLQRASYRPATWIGLLATPAMVIGAYLRGPIGIVEVAAVTFVVLGMWCLSSQSGEEPLVNLSMSFLVVGWVGGCAAFAGLLLAPSAHPHGHGVALIACTMALVVANDVGAFLVGSKFGRRALAAKISPGKTVEGVLGGTLLSLLLAGLVISRIHPLGLGSALLLGAVVAVLAPCGDLLESRVKRQLGVKDMSNLLPSHGGLFDRIDAMLFVLPAAYVLFALAKLS
jgi:phosphatidate cytidylyltransferase